jgi:SAM-dependent methyltransferase
VEDAAGARAVWEAIAPSYARARQRPWHAVNRFLATLPNEARVLDVGAGSGRHARAARERGLRCIAVDAARPFHPDVVALAQELPFRDASYEAVLLVAVLGTMPERDDRVQALAEARRVLRPGGKLLATVWARAQPKYVRAWLGLGPWRRVGPARILAPWAVGARKVDRPYYLYTRAMLRGELCEAGWTQAHISAEALSGGRWPDNLVVRGTRDGEPS